MNAQAAQRSIAAADLALHSPEKIFPVAPAAETKRPVDPGDDPDADNSWKKAT